jgi:D-alanine-D-alanine ligase-like ATP-grasp enzyme
MIRFLLIFWFVFYALRNRAFPWLFFQLNAPYFNSQKGAFSKLDIDKCIPADWRLPQIPLTSETKPKIFPVFMKPEWGQNSHGVFRVDNLAQFNSRFRQVCSKGISYIVQDAAREAREFEVFYIRSAEQSDRPATFSITEVINTEEDLLPINGIYNENTSYHDCTDQYSPEECETLWQHFRSICDYHIARVGLRANSKEDFLSGKLHVIEINLFLPMPLSILDQKMSWAERIRFIKKAMENAAQAAKVIPKAQTRKPVFWKNLIAHCKLTL